MSLSALYYQLGSASALQKLGGVPSLRVVQKPPKITTNLLNKPPKPARSMEAIGQSIQPGQADFQVKAST